MARFQMIQRSLAAVALAFVAACASVNPYDLNREELAAAEKSLSLGDAKAAAARAEALYAGRAGEADKYPLQRYFALYLTASAHMRAALGEPFLGHGAGQGSTSIGSAKATDVAHLVASMYYGALARELAPRAAKTNLVANEARQLPPALEEVGVETAGQRLQLMRLVACARLGFSSTINAELEGWPEMHTPEGADSLLARAKPDKELVPWIYYALFTHTRESSDTDAYLFGARARLLAESTRNAIPAERLAEIIAWVKQKKDENRLVFACSKCRKPFLPEKLRCLDDSTPITDFFQSSLD